jgi:hypothetical protein
MERIVTGAAGIMTTNPADATPNSDKRSKVAIKRRAR